MKSVLGHPAGIVALAICGVALIGLVEGLLYAPDARALVKIIGACALLGAFLGTIYATDSRAGLVASNRAPLRALICGGLGLAGGLLFGMPVMYLAPFAALMAGLGWLGMTWARYVDF